MKELTELEHIISRMDAITEDRTNGDNDAEEYLGEMHEELQALIITLEAYEDALGE